MNDLPRQRVLLVGATGMLGGAITEAILQRSDLALRVLIRPEKRDGGEAFHARGAEVFEGDALIPDTLSSAMAGVHVVICTLPNDPSAFVVGHKNLIEAAEQAGVRRFIPSDFSVDYFKIDASENFNLAMRKQVVPLFADRRVRPIHVLIGAFMDTMLDPRAPFIDWENAVLPFFGDGVQPCDFTSVADAARYVAAACADPEAPEVLRIVGDVRSMPQFAESISRAYGLRI
jgi:nucleoside-diphosphate-sugar epimerase